MKRRVYIFDDDLLFASAHVGYDHVPGRKRVIVLPYVATVDIDRTRVRHATEGQTQATASNTVDCGAEPGFATVGFQARELFPRARDPHLSGVAPWQASAVPSVFSCGEFPELAQALNRADLVFAEDA